MNVCASLQGRVLGWGMGKRSWPAQEEEWWGLDGKDSVFPFLEKACFLTLHAPPTEIYFLGTGRGPHRSGMLPPWNSPPPTQPPLPRALSSFSGVKDFASYWRNISHTSRWRDDNSVLFPSFFFFLMRTEFAGWGEIMNREFSSPWNQIVPKTGPGSRIILLILEDLGGRGRGIPPLLPTFPLILPVPSGATHLGNKPWTPATITRAVPPPHKTPHPV